MRATVRAWMRRAAALLAAQVPSEEREAGSITVLVVFLAMSLVLVAGLVFDAGGALTDRQRAADIAEQATRYAADQVVPAPPDVSPRINPGRAHVAGLAFLEQEGVQGTVQASPTEVTVTVTIVHRTALLSVIGQNPLTVTGTSTATPLSGLKTAAATGGK
jgi:Flp pilus assembly protein TadG